MKASELIHLLGSVDPNTDIPVSFSAEDDQLPTRIASCHDEANTRCYQTIVEVAREGMVVLNQEYRVTYLNPYMLSLLALPAEALLGQSFSRLLAPEQQDFHPRQLLQRPQGRQLRLISAGGSSHWVRASASAIPGADGQAGPLLVTLTDLTHTPHIEQGIGDQESLADKIKGVTQHLDNLRTLRINLRNEALELEDSERIDAHPYWHRDRYLYLIRPQKDGKRVREYIGTRRERINQALAAVRREARYREVMEQLQCIESRIRTVTFKLDSFLTELARMPVRHSKQAS